MKIFFNSLLFFAKKKTTSKIFGWVLNTPLLPIKSNEKIFL